MSIRSFYLSRTQIFFIKGFNTTTTLVLICQNDQFSFGFLKITYLYLAQAITSIASLFGFWFVQKHFKISTKKMVSILSIPRERSSNIIAVCRNKCLVSFNSSVGHDRNLVSKFRVSLFYCKCFLQSNISTDSINLGNSGELYLP